jgi:hypothetical protein
MASIKPPPNSVASTSAEEGRQVKTTSLAEATSTGVSAARPTADEVVDGLAVREDVLRGAVAHEPDPDISDTKLAHCAPTPE